MHRGNAESDTTIPMTDVPTMRTATSGFLPWVAAALLVQLMLAPAVANAEKVMGLLVPSYFGGSEEPNKWGGLIAARQQHPLVPIIAIASSGSGPGVYQPSVNLRNRLDEFHNVGGVSIGYVYTRVSSGGARRDLDAITTDILRWKQWYTEGDKHGVDGIFVDEMPADPDAEDIPFYSAIYDYCKDVCSLDLVVGNTALTTRATEMYLQPGTRAADKLNVIESTYFPGYIGYHTESWFDDYDRDTFSNLATRVPTASNMRSHVEYALSRTHAGWIYIQDNRPSEVDYKVLPTYWTAQVEAVAALNTPAKYWSGSSTSNWADGNWADADDGPFHGAWADGKRATFVKKNMRPATITLSDMPAVVGMTFGGDGYTLTGGSIGLTGAGRIDTGQYDVTIDSVLAGSKGLWKVGTGTLKLGANNNVYGDVTVTTGTLKMGADRALGYYSNPVNITENGSLDLDGHTWNYTQPVRVKGRGYTPLDNGGDLQGTLFSLSDSYDAGSPNLTVALAGDSYIGGGSGGRALVIGAITELTDDYHVGGYKATKVGAGILRVTRASTFTGGLVAQAGTVDADFTAAGAPVENILPVGETRLAGGEIRAKFGSGSNTQEFAQTAIDAGASRVVADQAAGMLHLNTISRNAGGTVDFSTGNGATIRTITANCNFTGGRQSILGGYATYGKNTWAASGTGAGPWDIGGLNSFQTTFDATNDVDAPAGISSISSTRTINSLRFNDSAANSTVSIGSYRTLTVATGGILETSAVGSQTVTIGGGYLTSGNGQDLIVHQQNTSGDMRISSTIYGSIGLTKSGPGKLVLDNSSNFHSGGTTINDGVLSFVSANSLGSGSVTFADNGTLQYSGTAASANLGSRSITVNSGVTGTIDVPSGKSLYLDARAGGYGGMIKSGGGDLYFRHDDSGFSSTAYVHGGRLIGDTPTPFGNGGKLHVADGAGVRIDSGRTCVNPITLNGSGPSGLGALANHSGDGTWSGPITLQTDSAIAVDDGSLTITGSVEGIGALTKIGPGLLTLSGESLHQGGTIVSDGVLTLDSTGSMILVVNNSASSQITGDGVLNLDGTLKLDVEQVTVSTGSWTLVDVDALDETYGGTFSVAMADGSSFASVGAAWSYVDGARGWSFDPSGGLLTLSPVPEPAALSLVMMAIACIVFYACWKRQPSAFGEGTGVTARGAT